MKTTFSIIVTMLLTCCMCMTSCKKDEPSTLSISMDNVTIGSDGGKQIVVVTSNTSWNVNGNPTWCNVSPSSGKGNSSFEISVGQNKSDLRECSLVVQSTDGNISKVIKVVQNALEVNLSVNPTNIRFGSEKSDKKTMQITCNTEWSISNLPDWLDADQLAGNGDRTVTFTTKSENATASSRNVTISVMSGDIKVDVELTQSPGLSECYINPENIVTLWNGVAFLSNKHGNVKNYRVGIIKASDYNKYSQKELLELTRKFSAITRFNTVESIHSLTANTEYYLLTLAYDSNDQEGELIKTSFITKPDDDAEAFVAIGDDVFYNSNNDITWYTYPDGATDKYYTLFLSGMSTEEFANFLYMIDDEFYYDTVKLAWYLDNEIKKGSSNYKTKKGEAEIVETSGFNIENNNLVKRGNAFQLGYSIFFTWGVNVSNNKLSGFSKATDIYVEYNSISNKKEYKKVNMFNGKRVHPVYK